jgi:hypothetical protein
LTTAFRQLDYDATNVTINWSSIIRKEPKLYWLINGIYEPNMTIPGNIPIFINDSWHIMVYMSPRYYQLRKPYYYFGRYNTFLPTLEYMNIVVLIWTGQYHHVCLGTSWHQIKTYWWYHSPWRFRLRIRSDIISGCISTLPGHLPYFFSGIPYPS